MEEKKVKQEYLKDNVIDKGYDPDNFAEFMNSQKRKLLLEMTKKMEELTLVCGASTS